MKPKKFREIDELPPDNSQLISDEIYDDLVAVDIPEGVTLPYPPFSFFSDKEETWTDFCKRQQKEQDERLRRS